MPKVFSPNQGLPVRVYLQKELDGAESGELAVIKESGPEDRQIVALEIKESVGRILDLTNQGVCGTDVQLEQLGHMIDAIASSQDEFEPGVVMSATLANSFRLECKDCLNEACEMRDPDFPVDNVKKRLPIAQ